MRLTLLVPELIWPEPDDPAVFDSLDCPQLALLLARSQCRQAPPVPLEAHLMRLFDRPGGTPHAPFRLLGEADGLDAATTGHWICADPVHLRFHQDRLVLADSAALALTPAESSTLIDELNHYFPELGQFHAHHGLHGTGPARWYLQLTDPDRYADLALTPLSAVAGRCVERLLPESARASAGSRLLNEVQTLLHAQPTNQNRDDAGQMTVNSLWFSGSGAMPTRVDSRYDGVWGLDPLARGLARAAGVPTHPLPENATVLLTHAAADTEHLVVIEDTLSAVRYEDGQGYRDALATLEAHWFAPLRTALTSGNLHELIIETTTAYGAISWQCRGADRWKCWRRPQPLNAVAKQLAAAGVDA